MLGKDAIEPRVPGCWIEVIPAKFYGRYNDLVNRYWRSVSEMIMDMFRLS